MATVLVVDDDPANREFLRTLLVHRGHRVCEAADGDSALSLAGAEPPDAVITDVLMPGLDGYELARVLRSRPATSRVPIAFSTAHYGAQEIGPLARACGVRDLIPKPAEPMVVLAAIDALLSAVPVALPAGTGSAFAAEHRHALKTKLLEKTTALLLSEARLRAADDRVAELRSHAASLADRLAETQRVTHSGTWDLDPRTGLIVLSAGVRDLLRLPSSTVPQDRLWRYVHPEDLDWALALAQEALRTGRVTPIEIRVADTEGAVHEIVVSFRAAPVRRRRPVPVPGPERAERRVLDRINRAMFPRELPQVAAVDLAAACRPASDRLDGGGDWYDAVPVADGGVVLSIGDVAGQDRHAAAMMGPVRAASRAYAIEDPDPSRILARLNRYLVATYRDDTYVTAVIARYEPDGRLLTVASAGHPSPLLVSPGGAADAPPTVVALTPLGPALGIFPDVEFAGQRLVVAPGAALCLYTDGLTDHRAEPGPGTDRDLARVVSAAYQRLAAGPPPASPAAVLVEHVLDGMLAGAPPHDDVCLVVLRVPPT
jgi:serine phosphatase RsbU (regulator of sigma subunit)/CheY-like chemotaxis protein